MRRNIYKNNDDVFLSATRSVTGEFDLDDLESSVESIERKYLKPVISDSEYQSIISTLYSGTLTTQQNTMLRHARTAVGYLALLDHLPVLNTKIGNSGLFVVTGNDRVAASEYRTEDLKRTLRNKGYAALDDLANYIEDNTAFFPDYLASPERTNRLNSLCITPHQFQQIYGQSCPQYLFLQIQKHIRDAEIDYLVNHIGQEMYDSLVPHAQNQAQQQPVPAQYAPVLRHAQYAVVHKAMTNAVPQLSINITADGLVVLDNSRNRNASPAKVAAADRWPFILVNQANQVGAAHLTALIKHLNAQSSDTVFAEYFLSEHYTEPNQETQSLAQKIDRGGFFGL